MPRLLIVATTAGTIDIFLLPFAKHFRRLGWTVDALASEVPLEHAKMRESFDAVHEARWSRNPLHPSNFLVAARQVRSCVETRDYDIVHVHTPVASFVTRLALRSRRGHKPQVVYTAHGFHFHPRGGLLENATFVGLERVAGRWTDYLVVMNSDDLAAARRHRLVPPERLVFMPGIGVDTSRYSAEPTTVDERASILKGLGLESGRYVLQIGELNAGKRPADAISGFGRVAALFPEVHLVFAGIGPLEQELRDLARSIGLVERVQFLGFRRDVPALLRSAAVVLLPSEREGLPRCLLEAMASGVPCVASDIRGSRDLVAGGCGLLFEVGNVGQLARALGDVLSSPDLARQLASHAAERVEEYDVRHVLSLHEKLYAEALGHIGRGADRAA